MIGAKLALTCVVGLAGAGCLAPLSTVIGKEGPIIWKSSSEFSPPILICQSEKPSNPKIFVSLGFKGTDKKEIVLKAFTDVKQPIEDNVFNLYFFNNGKSKLGELGGEDSHRYGGDNISCSKNIFVAAKEKNNFETKRWESQLEKITLTLEEGCSKESKKECWVKINEDVGLDWKEGAGVKVIFDN